MASSTGNAANIGGEYPVSVEITDEREINRLWGIPFVGVAVRGVLAIPHSLVLAIMGFGINVWLLIGWLPILLNGRVPGIAVKFLTEYLHRGARVGGYVAFLLPGGYPPLEPGMPVPVDVQLDLDSLEMNKFWGIPFVGISVRALVLLPQLVVLSFLMIAVILTWLVLWIPILASGRYPEWAARLYGTTIQYVTRVSAYALLLPVPYPPIWPD